MQRSSKQKAGLMAVLAFVAASSIVTNALVSPAHPNVMAQQATSPAGNVDVESTDDQIPLLVSSLVPNQIHPLVGNVAAHRAIGTVVSTSGVPSIEMGKKACLGAVPFDFTLWMGYYSSAPSTVKVKIDVPGTDIYVDGIIMVLDDAASSAEEGEVTVDFLSVPFRTDGTYSVSIDSGTGMAFDPFCDFTEDGLASHDASPAVGVPSTDAYGNCRTEVFFSAGSPGGYYTTHSSAGNVWREFLAVNFPVGISYNSFDCNSPQPYPAGVGGGFGLALYGQNEPPVGGTFNIETGIMYKGGDKAYEYPYGSASLKVRPAVALLKSPEGKIKLESASVLGKNKQSCTSWPSTLGTAFGFIPTAYYWSVLSAFYLRTYCSTNWEQWVSGTSGNRDYAGVYIREEAYTGQTDVGARIVYTAGSRGLFSMPVWIGIEGLGNAKAEQSNPTSYDRWVTGTIAQPTAKVV